MIIFAFYLLPMAAWTAYQWCTNHEIVWWEALVQLAGTMLVILLVVTGINFAQMRDSGVVIGRVSDKDIKQYSCNMFWSDHSSYGCQNYVTRSVRDGQSCYGSGKDRRCTPKYKTQYKHIYPWERDYRVSATVGSTTIDRVDRQGANIPPRWSEVYKGEPYAAYYGFNNYVLAASNSIFNRDAQVVEGLIAPKVVDYYRIDNRLTKNVELSWKDLMEQSAKAGVNIMVFKGPNTGEEVAKTLKGYKIYDLVVTLDGNNKPEIRSWSKTDIVNIQVRDLIEDNPETWINEIGDIVAKYYVKPDEKDFEYLAYEAEFPIWGHIIVIILLAASIFGITFLFASNSTRKYRK